MRAPAALQRRTRRRLDHAIQHPGFGASHLVERITWWLGGHYDLTLPEGRLLVKIEARLFSICISRMRENTVSFDVQAASAVLPIPAARSGEQLGQRY